MEDVIITGAGRGIGRAIAIALDKRFRQIVVARTAVAAGEVVREAAKRGKSAEAVVGDLSTLASARALGEKLCGATRGGVTLVHNAGVWPVLRVLNEEGYESGFAVNTLGALQMQAPLLARGLVRRILVVGNAVMAKARFDAEATPFGVGFEPLRSHASSKLALAVAMQDLARETPELDVAFVYPGPVRTELGHRDGFFWWLARLLQRRFDPPEAAGERIARIIERGRWSAPGEATWFDREEPAPWPLITDKARSESQRAIARALTPVAQEAPPPSESSVRTGITSWRPPNDSTLN